jgi:formylglycine-generating enzyme required for sulfatase activity
LSGTVTPANATNQTILWSVKNAGGTGAAITNGNTLTSAAAGTVVVTATIANGTAIGTAYTQDFTITIFATPAQYRELILATPDAVSPVTITGDSAYNASDNDTLFPSGRTVTVSPFKIAKYETTYELWYEVRQWAADSARGANRYVFGNAGREGHDGTDGAAPSSGTARTEPVTTINWRDAVIWCNAYSEREGKEPVYYTDTGYTTVLRTSTNESGTATAADGAVMKTTANGYRLPTEAQWEYAARGGKAPSTSGSFANKWAGTDTESALGNYAWYSSNSSSATHAAGGKLGNTLGLYDMSGNVWEWCWDWYSSSVGTGTVTDPTGAFAGSNRVVRGGSWGISASGCAVAYRSSYIPRSRYGNVGFRVVARP